MPVWLCGPQAVAFLAVWGLARAEAAQTNGTEGCGGGQSSPPDAVPVVLMFRCWAPAGPAEPVRGCRKRGGGRAGPPHNPQPGLRFMRILCSGPNP